MMRPQTDPMPVVRSKYPNQTVNWKTSIGNQVWDFEQGLDDWDFGQGLISLPHRQAEEQIPEPDCGHSYSGLDNNNHLKSRMGFQEGSY
jgi:hypothetical protein